MDVVSRSLEKSEEGITNLFKILQAVKGDFPVVVREIPETLVPDDPNDQSETFEEEVVSMFARDIEFTMFAITLDKVATYRVTTTRTEDHAAILDHIDYLKTLWNREDMIVIIPTHTYHFLTEQIKSEFDNFPFEEVGSSTLRRAGNIRGVEVLTHAYAYDYIIYAKKGWLKVNTDRFIWLSGVEENQDGKLYKFSTDFTTEIDPDCISLIGIDFKWDSNGFNLPRRTC